MERNKMIGLIIAITVALSSAALFVYAPSAQRPVRPGDYSGRGFARVVDFVDERWVLISPPDTNGMTVVGTDGPYVIIAPEDVNATAELLNRKNVIWYRDAVLEVNGIDLGGNVLDLNVYGFVLPAHGVGDVVPVQWFISIGTDGSYTAYAQEILTP
ncbi:MAG: hypothetical protein PWP76_557 [Candidatus Diapherotrites archaeon]|nr:hypothetical protein [Candidatus Diapherotrites archaeon]